MNGRHDDERMTAPGLCRVLLARLAPRDRRNEILGDLEESHRANLRRMSPGRAYWTTVLESLDMARALVVDRFHLGLSVLDFRLGFRMLRRYPGITALAVLALAFAIFVGAGTFEFARQMVDPHIPLPDGDRIVGVELRDRATGSDEKRTAWDFARWRDEVRTIEDLGAWNTRMPNLSVGEGPGRPIALAEISASAFRVARVEPLFGRTLDSGDEASGAPPVIVLGWRTWRDRLGADPEAVGRTVLVAGHAVTVVGVMPEGFAFPSAHDAWMPLPPDLARYEPLDGPSISVFGRLAEGVDREAARAELDRLTRQVAIEHPETHGLLLADVVELHWMVFGVPQSARALVASVFLGSNIPVLLFILLIGGNVALLLFARVVAREREMAVRTALGASRRRIAAQLFAEGIVLTALAAVIGLALVSIGLRQAFFLVETQLLEGAPLPFWFRPSLSPRTIVYTALLCLATAAVVGILPALKVTRGLQGRLQRASAGGGGFRFGGVWTGVIVCQIAVTCVAPVFTWAVIEERNLELGRYELAIDAATFLGARLELEETVRPAPESDALREGWGARYAGLADELVERFATDARVAGVTFAARMPRTYHPWNQIEVEGPSATPRDERGHRLGRAEVDVDFFSALGIPVVRGRDFGAGDLQPDVRSVIVNESFVERILGGRNPVGRRFRYLTNQRDRDLDPEPGPWHVIVGVVPDMGVASGYGAQGVYHPARVEDLRPLYVVAAVPGGAEPFAAILQELVEDIDPGMRVLGATTLDRLTDANRAFYRFWIVLLFTLTGVALILSLGGIYAITSFTVSQRTREIGIRVALGSSRVGVAGTVLRRALLQVGSGVVAGVGLMVVLLVGAGERLGWDGAAVFLTYALLMAAVCLTASIVPVRRILGLEVRDALGVEG